MLVTQDDLDKLAAEQDDNLGAFDGLPLPGLPYLVVAHGAMFPRPTGRTDRIHAIRGLARVAGLATWRVARWAAVLAAGAVVVWMAFAVPDLGLWTR